MRRIKYVLLAIFSFLLIGCHGEPKNTIRVGTIAGPETQIMQVAANYAKKEFGLNVIIVTFTDYNLPNRALSEGDIDANMFQHVPFLETQIKEHGYKLTPVGKVFVYPMGIYSDKIKNIADVPDGAKVGIPSDPAGEARALLLLQKAGLITLKNNIDTNATINSIASNPKNLQIQEVDPAMLPRALQDLDIAAINTNYAIPAGYYPGQALFLESAQSPYANVVVVQTKNKDELKFQELVKALHSQPVLQAAQEIFGEGAAIPAWDQQPQAPSS